jgi:large subunit ribosomal protein L14
MITGVGDIITLSIITVIPGAKVKKGQVLRGVIVRTRSKITRNDGSLLRFDDNAVVLIDKDGNPIATRVFGSVAREVRQKNFLKIASLASEVV